MIVHGKAEANGRFPVPAIEFIMKPFFGINNRLASIIISFVIFGYAVYSVFSDGILSTETFRFVRIHDRISHSPEGGSVYVKYHFDSATTSLFGLYELEIAMIKVCVSFLLFIVLLVGASQRSTILLRIWMMIHALIIVLGFLTTIITLTDSHINSSNANGIPTHTLAKFLITLAFSLWFFAAVLSLHEEIQLEAQHTPEENIIRNYVIAKKGSMVEEKCPPFYDC